MKFKNSIILSSFFNLILIIFEFSYGTYAKNKDLDKYFDGTFEYQEEEKQEAEGEEEEEEVGGYTIKGCAALFKDDISIKNIKPRRIKPINEEKYFNAISKMQPKYLLKAEQKNQFFLDKVGIPLSHFKDIIKKINE